MSQEAGEAGLETELPSPGQNTKPPPSPAAVGGGAHSGAAQRSGAALAGPGQHVPAGHWRTLAGNVPLAQYEPGAHGVASSSLPSPDSQTSPALQSTGCAGAGSPSRWESLSSASAESAAVAAKDAVPVRP